MPLNPRQVILYAADPADQSIALAAAAIAGIPACQVTGNFFEAWIYTASGDYLVIAVGEPANNALYYNPCGWPNPAGDGAGFTPFDLAASPRDTLPGANWYVNAAGQTAYQSLELAAVNAYYATTGRSVPGITPPSSISPTMLCTGSANVSCPCEDLTPLPPTGLYYGSDLGTNALPPINSCGMAFYIGQMGGGIAVGTSSPCGYTIYGNFSSLAAQAALNNHGAVYGSWFLLGPRFANDCGGATTLAEADAWGVQQAEAAVAATGHYAEINRLTIFGDVEPSSWSSDVSLNQAVVSGFIRQIQALGRRPGIYSGPCAWQEITGAMPLPCGVVVWTAEFAYAEPPACPPQFVPIPDAACPDRTVGPQGFGGILPNIWQYYQSYTVDWDVANALPE